METTKAVYLGNLRTEAVHLQSGAKITTDAPVDNQGKGEAFSPTDLFAVSYGCCALTIMGIAAQTHGFNIDGAEVKTTKVMASNPRHIAELIVEFIVPDNHFTEKERKIIEKASIDCPVANTVASVVKITKTISYKSY
ncbi:MAG: OsmC family protein [Dysgonamonadaceae bacterium]|jgi:uncharacterized OsmC-like protein|nr:OsmC family protein [Dysgonamonadaceae bacterium]